MEKLNSANAQVSDSAVAVLTSAVDSSGFVRAPGQSAFLYEFHAAPETFEVLCYKLHSWRAQGSLLKRLRRSVPTSYVTCICNERAFNGPTVTQKKQMQICGSPVL